MANNNYYDDATAAGWEVPGSKWNAMATDILAGKNLAATGGTVLGTITANNLVTTGTIELGHASDTTLSRVSAGRIAVEGVNVVTTSSTDTLTNKTISAGTIASDLDFNGTDAKDLALGTFKAYANGNVGGTVTIDWNNGAVQTLTATANITTMNFTAPTVDSSNYARLMLVFSQDGSGSKTSVWPATVKWKGGSAPTLTTTASREDILTFVFNGTNYAGVADLNFDL